MGMHIYSMHFLQVIFIEREPECKGGKRKSILVSPALVRGMQSKNGAKLQPKQQDSSLLIFYLAPSSNGFSMDPSSLSTLELKPGEQAVNRIKLLFSLCGWEHT